MSPERVLAKNKETGTYVLIAAATSKEFLAGGYRILNVYQKYPTVEFDPSDLSKIETGLFNMRTLRNSRSVYFYRVELQEDEGKLDKYTIYSGDGIVASNVRTLAICQKLAVEEFCRNEGYEIIQRF